MSCNLKTISSLPAAEEKPLIRLDMAQVFHPEVSGQDELEMMDRNSCSSYVHWLWDQWKSGNITHN